MECVLDEQIHKTDTFIFIHADAKHKKTRLKMCVKCTGAVPAQFWLSTLIICQPLCLASCFLSFDSVCFPVKVNIP